VKSFEIDKRLIYGAWEKVRASNGAPGVDAVGIGLFEEQLRDNLYRLWNRMSSGSYFPGPVRGVEIPKGHGEGVRLPGVPNKSPQVQLFRRAPQVELRGGCASSGGWWLEFGVPGAARSRRLILFVFDRAGGLR
jgi:hypothetical protein